MPFQVTHHFAPAVSGLALLFSLALLPTSSNAAARSLVLTSKTCAEATRGSKSIASLAGQLRRARATSVARPRLTFRDVAYSAFSPAGERFGSFVITNRTSKGIYGYLTEGAYPKLFETHLYQYDPKAKVWRATIEDPTVKGDQVTVDVTFNVVPGGTVVTSAQIVRIEGVDLKPRFRGTRYAPCLYLQMPGICAPYAGR